MIRGQEILCNRIDSYVNLDKFPRTLMLIGASGSGKHLLCEYVANKFNLQQIDITEIISLETIEEISERVEPYLYIIEINKLSIKEQNIILKFLEEPLANSIIVLLAETVGDILDTVKNRCQQWYLQNYTIEYLREFSDNDQILKICNTPGQIKQLVENNFEEIFDLANKVVNKIAVANLPNVLTIPNKLGFKNERGKIDPRLFIAVLLSCFRDAAISSNNRNVIDAYKLTCELSNNSKVRNIDLKYLMDKYLIEVRELMRRS